MRFAFLAIWKGSQCKRSFVPIAGASLPPQAGYGGQRWFRECGGSCVPAIHPLLMPCRLERTQVLVMIALDGGHHRNIGSEHPGNRSRLAWFPDASLNHRVGRKRSNLKGPKRHRVVGTPKPNLVRIGEIGPECSRERTRRGGFAQGTYDGHDARASNDCSPVY